VITRTGPSTATPIVRDRLQLFLDRLKDAGTEPAVFSIKCFAAAMLAYYIALRIGLSRPTWAVTTSYIVAQPLAGAVLSKAAFRIVGTILGAAAAVILVPSFVNEPAALSLGLALWLGLCLYFSLLDRTPRAYTFLLAGYTASIIGFPAVAAPGQIFITALARVEEITLGILCASLLHGTILPRTVTGRLMRRIDGMLADAERWSRDAIAGTTGERLTGDRRTLALDLGELHQLATHLPFDVARSRPRIRLVRALQDQLSLSLPLASAVEDRLLELRRMGNAPSPELSRLIAHTRDWLEGRWTLERSTGEAGSLIERAREIEPPITFPLEWAAALELSLVARLAELIAVHRDARLLRVQIAAPSARPVAPAIPLLLATTSKRPLHRDRAHALRAALATIATVLIGCAFWIASGWGDGAGAVLIAGVCCALFGNRDEPAPAVMRFFWGSLIGMAGAALYVFAIFPAVTDFVILAASLAPAALLLGGLSGQPQVSLVTLGAVLGFFNGLGLADRYAPDFTGFVNGSIAQLVGTLWAVVMVGLFLSVGSERSVERLVRAGWRDLARRSNAPGAPDPLGFTSRMLDRISLLAPRLAARRGDVDRPLLDALIDLRIGLAAGELRSLRQSATAIEEGCIAPVLDGVAEFYASRRYDAPAPPHGQLLSCLDRGLDQLTHDPDPARRRAAIHALTSLRRNLFPDAPAFTGGRA
jgi:uncharacterized membrane protein YccC